MKPKTCEFCEKFPFCKKSMFKDDFCLEKLMEDQDKRLWDAIEEGMATRNLQHLVTLLNDRVEIRK